MAKQASGKYNRKLEISEPITVSGRMNEEKTELQVKYSSYPARKIETPSNKDPKVENNAERAILEVDWDLRYIPNFYPTEGWELQDKFDGRKYLVTNPAVEIERAKGILVKTRLVE